MENDIKLLGVKIDEKVQWGDQVEQVKVKAVQDLGLIKHAEGFFL